ncbi:MAG TPA: hypothetical protein PKE63_09270 [Lacibacter sp.]|nr:hypothetical protein [Lacibacter sp.]HMO90390.1 hypothetical protein [Lacibacter sp.]HMP87454.1 hypothetical protein [Lacibacter sp.]
MNTRNLILAFLLLTAFSYCNDVEDEAEVDIKIEKTYEERVQENIQLMKNSPEWLAEEQRKADERGIPLDSMLLIDARWMVDQSSAPDKGEQKPAETGSSDEYQQRIRAMEDQIRGNKEWMDQILLKAKDRNISVDSMIRIDAKFFVDAEEKNKTN